MNSELAILGWAIVLGLVQVMLAASLSSSQRGMAWAAGPRDGAPPPVNSLAGRMDRARGNFLETFAFFAAAVLAVVIAGKTSPNTLLGAQIYFWARVAYVPTYAIGVPLLRTLVWAASMIGLVMVLVGLLR